MRVKCSLCEFEKDGFCTKKRSGGKLAKVKINKRRTCSLYQEDAFRVLAQFRKKEKHLNNIKRLELLKTRRAELARKIEEERPPIHLESAKKDV